DVIRRECLRSFEMADTNRFSVLLPTATLFLIAQGTRLSKGDCDRILSHHGEYSGGGVPMGDTVVLKWSSELAIYACLLTSLPETPLGETFGSDNDLLSAAKRLKPYSLEVPLPSIESEYVDAKLSLSRENFNVSLSTMIFLRDNSHREIPRKMQVIVQNVLPGN